MTTPGFYLRHIVFLGPQRTPACVEFGLGLNIVYGASDTGKSFLVEAIDFMLGGRPPLRDLPERIGYDRIQLGIETFTGEAYTIFRRYRTVGVFACIQDCTKTALQMEQNFESLRISTANGVATTSRLFFWRRASFRGSASGETSAAVRTVLVSETSHGL